MGVLTKEQAYEMRDIIRRAIRNTAIYFEKDLWRNLKRFKINYDKPVTTNVNSFLSHKYIKGFLDEIKRNSKEESEKYILLNYIILSYLYFMQAEALYVDNLDELDYHDKRGKSASSRFYDIAFDPKKEKINLDEIEFQYEFDEAIVNIREKQRNLKYVNCPFMLVGKASISDESNRIHYDAINIVIMEFLKNDSIQYFNISINAELEKIISMRSNASIEKYLIFEDYTSPYGTSYIYPIGGYTVASFFNTASKQYAKNIYSDKEFEFLIVDATSTSNFNKYKNDSEFYDRIFYNGITKDTFDVMLDMYICHSAFEIYRSRTPEIKEYFKYVERMEPTSKLELMKDYPVINKLIYTKYKYINDGPDSHVSKGGTHASPCQHERKPTMRYNPKTGKRDIFVRGSIVNKGAPKTKYYKNK